MHVKRDTIALLALGIGGLLASSLTAAGVVMGVPVLALGLSAVAASTADRVRSHRVRRAGPTAPRH
ncbi:hypothetical protein ACFO0N_17690 [Halobium salinum]|uniref:Secreted protein n=1 Tax=Halobium salinum TaxID=1364940 RepID=A0ABD5PH53_9EURY|nr:hypothetical protein [Halobium salinum]